MWMRECDLVTFYIAMIWLFFSIKVLHLSNTVLFLHKKLLPSALGSFYYYHSLYRHCTCRHTGYLGMLALVASKVTVG
jgi:hypothetical protein